VGIERSGKPSYSRLVASDYQEKQRGIEYLSLRDATNKNQNQREMVGEKKMDTIKKTEKKKGESHGIGK